MGKVSQSSKLYGSTSIAIENVQRYDPAMEQLKDNIGPTSLEFEITNAQNASLNLEEMLKQGKMLLESLQQTADGVEKKADQWINRSIFDRRKDITHMYRKLEEAEKEMYLLQDREHELGRLDPNSKARLSLLEQKVNRLTNEFIENARRHIEQTFGFSLSNKKNALEKNRPHISK